MTFIAALLFFCGLTVPWYAWVFVGAVDAVRLGKYLWGRHQLNKIQGQFATLIMNPAPAGGPAVVDEEDDEDEEPPPPPRKKPRQASAASLPVPPDDEDDEEYHEDDEAFMRELMHAGEGPMITGEEILHKENGIPVRDIYIVCQYPFRKNENIS